MIHHNVPKGILSFIQQLSMHMCCLKISKLYTFTMENCRNIVGVTAIYDGRTKADIASNILPAVCMITTHLSKNRRSTVRLQMFCSVMKTETDNVS